MRELLIRIRKIEVAPEMRIARARLLAGAMIAAAQYGLPLEPMRECRRMQTLRSVLRQNSIQAKIATIPHY
jgi:predicted metallo-beta-lactamase superfamily hydrolase